MTSLRPLRNQQNNAPRINRTAQANKTLKPNASNAATMMRSTMRRSLSSPQGVKRQSIAPQNAQNAQTTPTSSRASNNNGQTVIQATNTTQTQTQTKPQTQTQTQLQSKPSSIDGVITGDTPAQRTASASAERIAVIWSALTSSLGGQPPNLSAENAMAYVTGIYLGTDTDTDIAPTPQAWSAFFKNNIATDGKLADTLDVSMFSGIDANTMKRALSDASALFYCAQQSQLRAQSADTRFDPNALTLADEPAAAQGAFVRALQNDMLQTGTSDYLSNRVNTGDAAADAITNSHSQDFSVAGISHDAIVNGLVTDADLANHAGVKALLFTGNEVMGELIAQGLWDGPTLAQLDSNALTNDPTLAVYEVSYTAAGSDQPITRLVGKDEFDSLVQQHQDGTIHLQTDNMVSEYVSSSAEDGIGANAYSFSYLDANGDLQQATNVPAATRDNLVAQHEAGSITILSPTIENASELKVFWAQRALLAYDATRTPIYDNAGNIVSGQSADIRLAQNYYQQYQHFEGATQTSDFKNRIGQARTGTSLAPLLNNDPIAAAPQVSDATALDFMYDKMGVAAPEEQNLLGFMQGMDGVTDTAQLSGHWAQAENKHPDHSTGFLPIGGRHGNKDQAISAVGAAQDALAQRDRYEEGAVGDAASGLETALTEVKADITAARVFDGVMDTAVILSLGADAATLYGAQTLLERAAIGATQEESAALLSQSAENLAQRGEFVSLEALMADPASPFSTASANPILAQSASTSADFWAAQGANGLAVASSGAIGQQVLQGKGADVSEIKPAGVDTPQPSDSAGLSPREHIQAINQAVDLLNMRDDGASTADLSKVLFGSANAPLIEQTLQVLPQDVRTELANYQASDAVDTQAIARMVANGDTQGLVSIITAQGSPAQQWSAFHSAYLASARGTEQVPPLMADVLSALSPEVGAAVVSYEQSSIVNGTNPDYGDPQQPLDTRGPALATLAAMARAVYDPTQADKAGAILLDIGQTTPGIGAQLLNTVMHGGSDSTSTSPATDATTNPSLAAILLSHVIEQGDAGATAAGNMLAALDALQVAHGPRQLGGSVDLTQPDLTQPDLTPPDVPPPNLLSLSVLGELSASLGAGGDRLRTLAQTTAAYVAGSEQSTWQGVRQWIAALVQSTPTPSKGLEAYDQFLNNPFETWKDQGPILGALALDHYGIYNAAELLADMPAPEAAANLKLLGEQAASQQSATDLFKQVALQSPTAAASIIVDVLGPNSPFGDGGVAQVLEWFKQTGPQTAANIALSFELRIKEEDPSLAQALESAFDTVSSDYLENLPAQDAAVFLSDTSPEQAASILSALDLAEAATVMEEMVKSGDPDKVGAILAQMATTSTADAAQIVRSMTFRGAAQALQTLESLRRQNPVSDLPGAKDILDEMPPADAAAILSHISQADAVNIFAQTQSGEDYDRMFRIHGLMDSGSSQNAVTQAGIAGGNPGGGPSAAGLVSEGEDDGIDQPAFVDQGVSAPIVGFGGTLADGTPFITGNVVNPRSDGAIVTEGRRRFVAGQAQGIGEYFIPVDAAGTVIPGYIARYDQSGQRFIAARVPADWSATPLPAWMSNRIQLGDTGVSLKDFASELNVRWKGHSRFQEIVINDTLPSLPSLSVLPPGAENLNEGSTPASAPNPLLEISGLLKSFDSQPATQQQQSAKRLVFLVGHIGSDEAKKLTTDERARIVREVMQRGLPISSEALRVLATRQPEKSTSDALNNSFPTDVKKLVDSQVKSIFDRISTETYDTLAKTGPMTPEETKKYISTLNDILSEEYGIIPPTIVYLPPHAKIPTSSGCFSASTWQLVIFPPGLETMSDPVRAVEVIVHELTHAYQYQLAQNRKVLPVGSPHETLMMLTSAGFNLQRYERANNGSLSRRLYYHSWHESHAFYVGSAVAIQIMNFIQKKGIDAFDVEFRNDEGNGNNLEWRRDSSGSGAPQN